MYETLLANRVAHGILCDSPMIIDIEDFFGFVIFLLCSSDNVFLLFLEDIVGFPSERSTDFECRLEPNVERQ